MVSITARCGKQKNFKYNSNNDNSHNGYYICNGSDRM